MTLWHCGIVSIITNTIVTLWHCYYYHDYCGVVTLWHCSYSYYYYCDIVTLLLSLLLLLLLLFLLLLLLLLLFLLLLILLLLLLLLLLFGKGLMFRKFDISVTKVQFHPLYQDVYFKFINISLELMNRYIFKYFQ